MPRKQSSNIINLPNQQPVDKKLSDKELQNKVKKGHEAIIHTVDKNRFEGLKALEEKIGLFDTFNNDIKSDRLYNVESAIRAIATTTEAINRLTDMLRHDLLELIGNVEKLANSNWRTAAYVQSLLNLLMEKGTISDEELKQSWNKTITTHQEEQSNQS